MTRHASTSCSKIELQQLPLLQVRGPQQRPRDKHGVSCVAALPCQGVTGRESMLRTRHHRPPAQQRRPLLRRRAPGDAPASPYAGALQHMDGLC